MSRNSLADWSGAQLFFLALLSSASPAFGQSYAIDWFKIGGSSGRSTNNFTVLEGTIGPASSAHTSTNPNYTVSGGFLSIFLIQTPDAPILSISQINGVIAITWSSAEDAWQLQSSTDLQNQTWAPASEIVAQNGTSRTANIVTTGGARFYRLYHATGE
jgi:hypothetical protein